MGKLRFLRENFGGNSYHRRTVPHDIQTPQNLFDHLCHMCCKGCFVKSVSNVMSWLKEPLIYLLFLLLLLTNFSVKFLVFTCVANIFKLFSPNDLYTFDPQMYHSLVLGATVLNFIQI